MRTLETRIQILPDGKLVIPAIADLQPGEYQAVLVIEAIPQTGERQPLNFPVDDLGNWPEDLSLRREDMYGDDGR